MRSIGLKLGITGTIAILVTTAVVLGNIIVILFWHRSLVLAEVSHVRTITALWGQLIIREKPVETVNSDDLGRVCEAVGTGCRGMAFFNGVSILATDLDESDLPLVEVTQLAGRAGEEAIRFVGSAAGGFLFGGRRMVFAVPLELTGQQGLGMGMVVDMKSAYQLFREHQKIILAYMLLNILLLTVIGLFRMINLVVRPIERMVRVSETYGLTGGLSFVTEGTGSELRQLSYSLNGMMARIEEDRKKLRQTIDSLEQANARLLETRTEMVRAEKLAAVGRLSAGLAHEIGNPIGIVQGYLELLAGGDIGDDDRRQFSSRAIAELQRISELIHRLLDFSRASTQTPEAVSVQQLLREVVEMFSTQKKVPDVDLQLECPGGCDVVIASGQELRQVFLNCLLNAADSIGEQGADFPGRITVSCSQLQGAPPMIRVAIADNGKGIEEQWLETIFDPFFSTKEPGKGTGLGLSVSHSILESVGGRIRAANIAGGGAEIVIELPVAASSELKG
jgi:hypothetical protein